MILPWLGGPDLPSVGSEVVASELLEVAGGECMDAKEDVSEGPRSPRERI